MSILLILLGMVVFLVVFARFIMFYTEKSISLLVEKKHRDAEMILSSGIAPPKWNRLGLIRLGAGGFVKYRAMWKMGRIINYFEHTPMVENDEARELIVSRLKGVRSEWKGMNWEEIYPYKKSRD